MLNENAVFAAAGCGVVLLWMVACVVAICKRWG
jgi:hypothetical protein